MTLTETENQIDYQLSRWDLTELLPEPSESEISRRLTELRLAVEDLETQRPRLEPAMAPEEFLDILRRYEAIIQHMLILSAYGSLWFSEDTQSRAAQRYRNRIQQILTEHENRILFFDLFWKGLDDEQAERLLPTGTEVLDYKHFLEDLRRRKPFTLDERSEQIINLKDANGISAVMTLYAMLTNRLEFRIEVDGEHRTLTRDGLMSYAFSRHADLRAAAYQELYRVYEEEATVLAQIYVNRVRDWSNENVRLRGFESPIAVRNLANDIPNEAVDVLLRVVRDNAGLFRRYFELKAEWLGLDKLRRYDLYAPLTASDREIPYEEAVHSVLSTLESFHPTFAAQAKRVFDERHIDSEIRKGKRGGAFCSTVLPSMTPWVLVNYTGKVRDVATLAHELGHAVHSMMAEDHSVLTQHPSLPLAETASVFSEMLMTDRLLAEEEDPLTRRELLAAFVDDIYATVLRQTYFVLFELTAHEAIGNGASLDELSRLYEENLEEQFEGSVEVASEFQYEWLSIPHIFHTPFYCYAYSFGQLLVLALYRRYQEEGDAFKPGYLKLLSYGGSARPQEILEEVDIDITDPAFWQGGFTVVEERIQELEAIEV